MIFAQSSGNHYLAEPGDAILIEQIDRITRLSEEGWRKLKATILNNRIKVISMDLPTSYNFANIDDKFQIYRMLGKAIARSSTCWDAPVIQSLKLKRRNSKIWPTRWIQLNI